MGIDAQLLVRTRKPLSPLEVRKLSRDLVAAFGVRSFYVCPPGDEFDPDGRHALEIVSEYVQDGPTILPEPGEQFVDVHVATRWYGKGYERGDLILLIAVTEWLEIRIAGCSVWYGGDSSGVLAAPFDAAARRELFAYFAARGHDPYTSAFGSAKAETCKFCADSPLHACLFGPNGTGYVCAGCGLHRLVARDGAKTEAYERWPDGGGS